MLFSIIYKKTWSLKTNRCDFSNFLMLFYEKSNSQCCALYYLVSQHVVFGSFFTTYIRHCATCWMNESNTFLMRWRASIVSGRTQIFRTLKNRNPNFRKQFLTYFKISWRFCGCLIYVRLNAWNQLIIFLSIEFF